MWPFTMRKTVLVGNGGLFFVEKVMPTLASPIGMVPDGMFIRQLLFPDGTTSTGKTWLPHWGWTIEELTSFRTQQLRKGSAGPPSSGASAITEGG